MDDEMIKQANDLIKRHGRLAPEGECKECDHYRAENITFHPSHTPSSYCESGKRPHCTCDACF